MLRTNESFESNQIQVLYWLKIQPYKKRLSNQNATTHKSLAPMMMMMCQQQSILLFSCLLYVCDASDVVNPQMTCVTCKRDSCFNCKEPWHQGYTCNAWQQWKKDNNGKDS